MRIIGMDIHRVFAEAVVVEDGEIKRLGRIGMTRNHLEAFARTLLPTDHVVVEATGNATAVSEILCSACGESGRGESAAGASDLESEDQD